MDYVSVGGEDKLAEILDIYQLSANLSNSIVKDLTQSYNSLNLGHLDMLDGTRISPPESVGFASLRIVDGTLSVYFKISQKQLDTFVMSQELELMDSTPSDLLEGPGHELNDK
tara:strand:- start:1134 stop:1472 length:339 start_codon:yes stop_codon:yes gene_type:complete